MLLMLLFIFFLNTLVAAAPTVHEGGLGRRDNNDSNIKPQIWVPIVIVALLVVIIVTMTWSRKRFRWASLGQAAAAGAGAFTAQGGTAQTRELTADQLTGGTSNNNSSSNNENSRTRRTRRPRRTPSQISTTSLPAYMKEPGEQELVIFRGPADMEDVPIDSVTAAVEMPVVEEDPDSENSLRERYTPIPDSPHDMPLLHPDESGEAVDRSTSALIPPANDQGRQSIETVNYNSDESSLMRIDTTVTTDGSPDPRGAAPAYFEVVDISEMPPMPGGHVSRINNGTTTTVTASNIAHNAQQAPPNENESMSPQSRRGTFRFSNIFGRHGSHRASQSQSSVTAPPVPPPPGIPTPNEANPNTSGHSRPGSAGGLSLTSTVSRTTQASPGNRSRSRISTYHRPSQSSSSLLSLVNPLVRKKSINSINNLTSPSLISLQSISAPLPHTLVKTEFTYPKSGPTPDQMKLISSRENLAGRFGLPYGDEAVRWARSRTELVEDSVPPPGFEEISGAGPSGLSASASGSGTNSTSGGSDSTTSTPPSSADTDVGGLNGSPDLSTGATTITLISGASPPVIRVDAASKPPTPRLPSPSPPSGAEDTTTAPASSSSSPSSIPSPNPASIPIPESPPTSPASNINANAQLRSLPSSETQLAPSKANKGKAPPPSAFRAEFNTEDDLFYTRAESRASSFRSFATANESLSEFGERTGNRKGTLNSNTMRSETPALSIAESRYYSGDDDDDDGDNHSLRGTTREHDDYDSGGETETEGEDSERRNRRLTVRA
ncbi:hypothetical protein L218DRAFT_1002379 [Marasmius fiardii PR-910]|nr:hypothetical protein L218DRAFT_1002379 [Marasmius fiardii PR-910]